MEDYVSDCQFAFVGERQILDAVLVANEIVEETRRKKQKGWVIKLNFEKAYDTINWRFLGEVFKKKGFGCRWRRRIAGCLHFVNFSVMINGNPRGMIKASRGLRQGNPYHLFLLVLRADALSLLLKRATERVLCRDMSMGREDIDILHLQFPDDTILFPNGDDNDVRYMLGIVELLYKASGLKINQTKSQLLE